MPLFNYVCANCGHRFERLLTSSSDRDKTQACPACGREEARREQGSNFAMGRSSTSSSGGCGGGGSPFS